MSNWNSDKATFNQFESAKIIGYEFICRSQAAGTNDKKWSDMSMHCASIWCMCSCLNCRVYHLDKYNSSQAANIKPKFTPEQQEMIDFLSNMIKNSYNKYLEDRNDYMDRGYYNASDTIKNKYIEIINKHRSK